MRPRGGGPAARGWTVDRGSFFRRLAPDAWWPMVLIYGVGMKVLVTGGTGFIGRHVVRALLERGDVVTVLSRDADGARRALGRVMGPSAERLHAVAWNPTEGGRWERALDGQDAVMHLAGEPAVGQRWSEAKKERILTSRTASAERIVEAIGNAENKPGVLVSASGVGYYGARGHEPLDESAAPGDDFLALLCIAWEGAVQRAEEHGVRVVRARFGIVLGEDGGALAEMVKPFKAFVGGPIGDGQQMVSWIHVDDVVGILLRCLDDAQVSGPVNVTAPEPVTNEVLSGQIGEVLDRPSFVRVPPIALRIRFGEGAEPLLTGQCAVPSRMRELGYEWLYPELRPALEQSLLSAR